MAISQGGVAIAQQFVPHYITNRKVCAMLIGGSVARHSADAYSDLEIGVFWHEPPADYERQQLIDRVGGERWTFHSYKAESGGVASEHYGLPAITVAGQRYTGALMVDVKHMTVHDVEETLTAVLSEYDTALEKQMLLSTLVHAIPLHGAEILAQWRGAAAAYPELLAIKIVQENLWFGPWFSPAAYIARNDTLVMHQHLLWAQQALLRILAALNRIYYPSREHKWLDRLVAEFTLAPLDLATRLRQVFCGTLREGWVIQRTLIEETIALVEQHLPAVDSVVMFAEHPEITIAWAQKRWEAEPPYTLMTAVAAGTTKRT
ncbi:MAG: hypothetical protein R3C14_15660 [Caldilineaceae bacterium]